MKKIIFLGTSLFGAQFLRESAEALGLQPIFLIRIDDYSCTPRQAIEACEYYEADVNSLDDILRAIREHDLMTDVVAITSLLDETFLNACFIAKQFNIAGPDTALANLTDKAKVRKMIPEFCPPSLTFTLSSISEGNLKHFLETHKVFNEFMLKPGISSGAVGISILDRTVTINQIKQLIHHSQIERKAEQNWILQPRISGRLHSLEGYVKDSQIVFLGFSRRVRKELTEVANEFPVDDDLPEQVKLTCKNIVEELVVRSGYKNGYFHCEFIIDTESATAYFIDGNMGRIAGGAIVQQLALVYGKTPAAILKHVIDLSCFNGMLTADFEYTRVTAERTLLIFYCIAEQATILGITPPDHMTSYHTQIAGNGKEIPAAGTSDSAWVGFLTGYKDNTLKEIKQFVINTNNGSVTPFYMLEEQQPVKASFTGNDVSQY